MPGAIAGDLGEQRGDRVPRDVAERLAHGRERGQKSAASSMSSKPTALTSPGHGPAGLVQRAEAAEGYLVVRGEDGRDIPVGGQRLAERVPGRLSWSRIRSVALAS
jgi:hypothetical protein